MRRNVNEMEKWYAIVNGKPTFWMRVEAGKIGRWLIRNVPVFSKKIFARNHVELYPVDGVDTTGFDGFVVQKDVVDLTTKPDEQIEKREPYLVKDEEAKVIPLKFETDAAVHAYNEKISRKEHQNLVDIVLFLDKQFPDWRKISHNEDTDEKVNEISLNKKSFWKRLFGGK